MFTFQLNITNFGINNHKWSNGLIWVFYINKGKAKGIGPFVIFFDLGFEYLILQNLFTFECIF